MKEHLHRYLHPQAKPTLSGKSKCLNYACRAQIPVLAASLAVLGMSCLTGCGGGSSGSGSTSGTTIVFQSNRDGDTEILRMDGNGGNVRRVTDNAVNDIDPAISPDGNSIAFVSNRTGSNEIFIVDSSGTRRLTNNSFNERKPSFSPDGRRLVFVSVRNQTSDLYILDLATLQETRITSNPDVEDDPTFAPDGNILFAGNIAGGLFQIQEIDPVSRKMRTLTSGDTDDLDPSVSPNGTQVAFVRQSDGRQRISIINRGSFGDPPTGPILGSPQVNAPGDADPCFSADGSKLFFSSTRNGNFEIYSMNIDGSNVQRLTENPAVDRFPSVR